VRSFAAMLRLARRIAPALAALVLAFMLAPSAALAREPVERVGTIAAAELPKEARETLALIRAGGPFPYKKDGTTFGNFERRLPVHGRGYYKEYTVKTPGAKDRGARRIVAGANAELYYTDDHYNSFKRIKE
jgi:ribonuclease T1